MGTRLATAATAFVIACGVSFGAEAAPKLISSNPNAGSTVRSAPASIRINFSEQVVPSMSGVAIANDHGEVMDTGRTQLNGNNPRQMVIGITSKMSAGTYTVAWHAVGGDGARVTGNFQFELKP